VDEIVDDDRILVPFRVRLTPAAAARRSRSRASCG
jgi:hypothetical protein